MRDMQLAQNIKRLRIANGYTQATLAKAIGIQYQYVSDMERGVRRPGAKTIAKLCEVFLCDELTLRFGERQEHSDPDMRLLQEEIASLSPDELLEVRALLRKWKRERG